LWQKFIDACDHFFERRNAQLPPRGSRSGGDASGARKRKHSQSDASASPQQNKLYGERDKLMRSYDKLKNELQTYENNIGFLSISSKGGGGLVKEMEKKMEQLREEIAGIIRKIESIDEHLDAE
jgi:archaellum component FlaC